MNYHLLRSGKFHIIIISAVFLCMYAFKEGKEKKEETPVAMPYQWYPPTLPGSMNFAGEAVPLERWEIREQFDRELLLNYYSIGNILYITKLTHRYFPYIEERLKANGIPDDFKYLCVAESNLQNLISKVGATGFWQFMPASATGYGLEINAEIDERYNLVKSTDAACKYLKMAYGKLGSWTAAAASYNCGQGGYNNQATIQKTKDYYNLLLPEETNHYIFRILTFKHLLTHARSLGFLISNGQGYEPLRLRSIKVTSSIPSLVDYAIQKGVSYKMLKICNPWLRGKSLTVKSGKEYVLVLPQ